MGRHRRRAPAWLLGLIIAVVVFTALLIILDVLGYGDDPVVESLIAVLG